MPYGRVRSDSEIRSVPFFIFFTTFQEIQKLMTPVLNAEMEAIVILSIKTASFNA